MSSKVIPEGSYKAVAIRHEFGQAETGTQFVRVVFKVLEEGDFFEWKLSWFGYFTDKTAQRTIESLRHCGWYGDELGDDMPGLGSAPVAIVVGHEEYKGNTQVRIKWVNKLGNTDRSLVKNAIDDTGFRTLNAKFKPEMNQVAAAAGVLENQSEPLTPDAGEPPF